MKNFQLDSAGIKELNVEEQQQVTGGIGLLLLGAMAGMMTAYNIGKVLGAEAYHLGN